MGVFPYLQCKLKVNGHIKKHKDIYLNVYSGNKFGNVLWSSLSNKLKLVSGQGD
jgi:hypothetical protein